MTQPHGLIFVPLALKQEQAEALMSAAHVVLQSAMVAKQTDTPEYGDLRAAYEELTNARDKALLKDRLANGGGVGEIMLQRLQRELAEEIDFS